MTGNEFLLQLQAKAKDNFIPSIGWVDDASSAAKALRALDSANEVPIDLTLEIDNVYEDGEDVQTVAQVQVSEPQGSDGSDTRSDWEMDEIFPHTGTGRTDGNSAYFVNVAASSRPDLIPVGTTYEFGT
jgi:hypothetical protein